MNTWAGWASSGKELPCSLLYNKSKKSNIFCLPVKILTTDFFFLKIVRKKGAEKRSLRLYSTLSFYGFCALHLEPQVKSSANTSFIEVHVCRERRRMELSYRRFPRRSGQTRIQTVFIVAHVPSHISWLLSAK